MQVRTLRRSRACYAAVAGIMLLLPSFAHAQSCPLPWGGSIDDGQSVLAYMTNAGDCSVTETRYCNSGSLSGDYQYDSCDPNCYGTPFGDLTHGQSVTAWFEPNNHNGSCQSEVRTCNYGTFAGTWTQPYCDDECYVNGLWTACGNCVVPWGTTIDDGQTVDSYPSTEQPLPCADVVEPLTCNDGTLSNGNQYNFCYEPCVWDGNYVTYLDTVTAYEFSSGNCASTEQRRCYGGANNFDGSFQYPSCTPGGGGSSPCNLPWGGTINDGDSVTAYLESSPAGSCTSETRNCSNGTLSGSYTNQSCTPGGGGGAGPADCK